MAARSSDPFASFRFKVEIQGVVEAHFQSVSGLSANIEVIAQPEGGVNTHVHQLKGKATYGNIVLKRGVTTNADFFSWMTSTINNSGKGVPRISGLITLYNEDGTATTQKWKFKDGWPCKWEGGSFDTTSSAALIETLEIVHEGLEKG